MAISQLEHGVNTIAELVRSRPALANDGGGPVSAFADRPFRGMSDGDGRDEQLELMLWTSVGEACDLVRLRSQEGGFALELGQEGGRVGLPVQPASPQETRKLHRLARQIAEAGFQATLEDSRQPPLLRVSRLCKTAKEALEHAEDLTRRLTERLGMELALRNLIRQRRNVAEVTDENLGDYLRLEGRAPRHAKAVLFSELTQCVRCRNNWHEVVRLSALHPDLQMGVVFLNKSRAAFKRKVFGEECPEIAAQGIVAPTAFLVSGGHVARYIGSRLDQPPPSPAHVEQAVEEMLGS